MEKKDGEREVRLSIHHSRERVAVLAEELARRTSVGYMTARAKTAAKSEARAVLKPMAPWLIGLAGATIAGLVVMKVAGRRALPVKRAIKHAAKKGAHEATTMGARAAMTSRGVREAVKAFWIVRGVKSRFSNNWVSMLTAALVTAGALAGLFAPPGNEPLEND